MLEVRNLTKIYKTKNGADVHALDGVSLQFAEKGMVFLLGKSGSGKSTLLNVCGGLDAPTGGEIIVKGRSSKDFSQSDFDSYRNTYVGFIFQEYNILNEFSVEDNIALALELQGKPKDKKAVAELLTQVDLEGYGKRKPNTLSGGQKQRIAIARALVKSPEIIMADEPTGALDSNTGKQVFETLKKLSKDKLVIVVSHDREFAEQYGDRIIELKDGKIISDVTKTQEQQKELSKNINVIGDVLCIKQGTELNDADFHVIKDYLKKSSSDIVIANNEKDVKAFKKVSRITDDGEKEVFRDTDEATLVKKEYTKADSKFIRSKLPAKHAMRIGVSSLRSKPVRLFFTIVLCTVAFTLFGLLSTMSFYDSESTFKETLAETEHSLVRLQKNFKAKEEVYQNGEKEYEYDNVFEARFSNAEIEELKTKFGADIFGGIPLYWEYNIRSSVGLYWNNQISGAAYLGEDNSLRGKITGAYPVNKDEVCISTYMADVIINCKTYDEKGEVLEVATRDELLGKKISINGLFYKIVGIIDSGAIPEKYDELKSAEAENQQLQYKLQSELGDGLHTLIFVNAERMQILAEENQPYTGDDLSWYRSVTTAVKNAKGQYEFGEWSDANYVTRSELPASNSIVYVNGEKASLGDQEVLLSKELFCNRVSNMYNQKIEQLNQEEKWDQAEKYYATNDLCNQVQTGGVWKQNPGAKDELVEFTDAELASKLAQLIKAVQKDGFKLTVGAKLFNNDTQSTYGDLKEFQIVGVILDDGNEGRNLMAVSDGVLDAWWNEQKVNIGYYSMTITKYQDEAGALYGNLYVPYERTEDKIQSLWEMYKNVEYAADDSRIKPTSSYIGNIEMIDTMVKSLSQVFLYVGLVLAVFAALLLSNFISVSISQKKKEIGILRAVGARSLDVFKIFFSESFVIATICVILAIIASNVICGILNAEVAIEFGAALFVFGFLSLVVLIAIAFVTTVVATFLPVWNAAKKKPVDSIRAL